MGREGDTQCSDEENKTSEERDAHFILKTDRSCVMCYKNFPMNACQNVEDVSLLVRRGLDVPNHSQDFFV